MPSDLKFELKKTEVYIDKLIFESCTTIKIPLHTVKIRCSNMDSKLIINVLWYMYNCDIDLYKYNIDQVIDMLLFAAAIGFKKLIKVICVFINKNNAIQYLFRKLSYKKIIDNEITIDIYEYININSTILHHIKNIYLSIELFQVLADIINIKYDINLYLTYVTIANKYFKNDLIFSIVVKYLHLNKISKYNLYKFYSLECYSRLMIPKYSKK